MPLEPFESVGDQLRQVFVVYLAAHSRPIAELLSPRAKPIDTLFRQQFVGMTAEPVQLKEFEAIRERLFHWVSAALSADERAFLLSVKRGEPDWQLLPFEHLQVWPAIRWKLHNVRNMPAAKHRDALAKLEQLLIAK
jgi:hypothetical protein